MKKRPKASTVVLASAIAALPLASATAQVARRPIAESPLRDLTVKFAARYEKLPATNKLVGIDNGNPIYQNARNEIFSLDPATGDMKFLGAEAFARFTYQGTRDRAGAPVRMMKWRADKYPGDLAIVGIDAAGHDVNRNARGEKFYLDPVTADMVFVK
jgi:hypothetical protein